MSLGFLDAEERRGLRNSSVRIYDRDRRTYGCLGTDDQVDEILRLEAVGDDRRRSVGICAVDRLSVSTLANPSTLGRTGSRPSRGG